MDLTHQILDAYLFGLQSFFEYVLQQLEKEFQLFCNEEPFSKAGGKEFRIHN